MQTAGCAVMETPVMCFSRWQSVAAEIRVGSREETVGLAETAGAKALLESTRAARLALAQAQRRTISGISDGQEEDGPPRDAAGDTAD